MTQSIRIIRDIAARLLRIGVATSATLLALGLLIGLAAGGGSSTFGPPHPHGLIGLLAGALMQLGLCVLIATPFVVVVTCSIIYARRGDQAIAAISATAALLIALSFIIGLLTR